MVAVTETVLDLTASSVREVNQALRALPNGARARLRHPRGRHNLAVGIDRAIEVLIDGPAGYYVGGLGKHASITVDGPAGWGAGENLMSGTVVVNGNASQSAAASAHGGTVIIQGDAGLRAGISLKGATLAVAGDVAEFSGFMAQAGTILVGGDAAEHLGDSLYEAVIYVGGTIKSLGSDARVEDLTDDDVRRVRELAAQAGFSHLSPEDVTKVASARSLYRFDALKDQRY
jgi:methylamine---glutamate N-methyltransferase subunit B